MLDEGTSKVNIANCKECWSYYAWTPLWWRIFPRADVFTKDG